MGINFIVVLPRTMEDPDVITRAQLAPAIWGRRNCRTGKHAKRTAESRGRGGYIGIYLYSGSYALHTHRIPRCALLWRIFWTVANRWKNMQRTTFHRNRRAIARLLRANVVRRVASHWFLTWLVGQWEKIGGYSSSRGYARTKTQKEDRKRQRLPARMLREIAHINAAYVRQIRGLVAGRDLQHLHLSDHDTAAPRLRSVPRGRMEIQFLTVDLIEIAMFVSYLLKRVSRNKNNLFK